MPTTESLVLHALRAAAEHLSGRTLLPDEVSALNARFKSASGNHRERARAALRDFTKLTDREIRVKQAVSKNADRAMNHLESLLKTWKPGT